MALAYNSRDLTITSGGRLSGQAKRDDGSWADASIDLHPKLGNENGRVDINGRNFATSAQEIRVQGTILLAKLKNRNRDFVDASHDLAVLLMVMNGKFVFLSQCVYYLILHEMCL